MQKIDYQGNYSRTEPIKDYRVTKSNDLIQNSKHKLSLQEQRILAYIICQIQPNETDISKYYEFDITKFCNICGISDTNNAYIRDAIKKLYDRDSIEIFQDGAFVPVRWLSDYKIVPGTNRLSIQIHFRMKPFLMELTKNFTTYSFFHILAFKSRYSVQMYELLRSFSHVGFYHTSILELKYKLSIANMYTDYRIFRRKVIEPAITEINQFSDIRVKYIPKKEGRKIQNLTFQIKSLDSIPPDLNAVQLLDQLDLVPSNQLKIHLENKKTVAKSKVEKPNA